MNRGGLEVSDNRKQSLSFISELTKLGKRDPVGNKARNLFFLHKQGYRIPKTITCNFDAYDKFKSGDESVLDQLDNELSSILIEGKKYSVRSSANIEDATSYSFAGQFSTHLNIEGRKAIIQAIQSVWKSAEKVNEAEYIKTTKSGSTTKMGVIIQEMVKPIFSGVVFTKNPLTGLDEVIVESVDGYGDALVQEGVTPNRWVYKWGEWIEHPDSQDDRISIIQEIIQQSRELAVHYGSPLDLEWCYDGQHIYWLQLRAITALESTKLYSNRISREFLPGMIKPLVWSVNIPMINSSWKDLFREVIGSKADSINIHNLSKQFHYRAYFNMGVIGNIFEVLGMPREALEILAGIESAGEDRPLFRPSSRTFVHLPRMLLTVLRKLVFSKPIEIFIRNYRKHYDRIAAVDIESLNYEESFDYIDELFNLNRYGSYMVIVSQLLNSLYNMMLKRMLSSYDINTEAIHLSPNTKRLRESDPRDMLNQLRKKYASIPPEEREKIEGHGLDTEVIDSQKSEFIEQFNEFMQQYGHLSDSGNDFSRLSWRETPDIVYEMIKSEPAEIQAGREDSHEKIQNFRQEKKMNDSIYKRALRYQEYRELVNSLYTFGYSLFRRFFLHIAMLLKNENKIDERDDIFYLSQGEIRNLIHGRLEGPDAKQRIQQRKDEMEKYADAILPEIIIGDSPPLILDKQEIGMELSGVATSGGHYTGPARVIRGVGDFGKISEGDVLVIPYSDVSWTPLFSLAKAVISESGGLLSHCSIVAREYGIPAIVSVDGATQIEDGTIIAVDGDNGQVSVLQKQ
ncbi:hypothetical protein EU528_11205 [Candidatus Thorarchaeota archaeon]|nr:MAG: hypothetical protein EU528_11205 [Candidatus Thorarchaeota archaeon]